jgi:DNA-binding MarR family transcriptional regulator
MDASPNRSDAERIYLFVQHLGRRIADINAEFGLTRARFAVLQALKFHGVVNVGELAAFDGVTRPAMTRLVRDMEAAGLVVRSPDARDARAVRVTITPVGEEVLDTVRRAKIALVATGLAGLGPAEQAAIAGALERLEALAEGAPVQC